MKIAPNQKKPTQILSPSKLIASCPKGQGNCLLDLRTEILIKAGVPRRWWNLRERSRKIASTGEMKTKMTHLKGATTAQVAGTQDTAWGTGPWSNACWGRPCRRRACPADSAGRRRTTRRAAAKQEQQRSRPWLVQVWAAGGGRRRF